jgi:hypothetical protein
MHRWGWSHHETNPTTVKAENLDSGSILDIKNEPCDDDQAEARLRVSLPVNMLKTRILKESGHEIMEILSDSDEGDHMGDRLSGTMTSILTSMASI